MSTHRTAYLHLKATSSLTLTKEDVLGWLWANGIDKAGTEAAVLAQIETSKNPPITKPPLPWL